MAEDEEGRGKRDAKGQNGAGSAELSTACHYCAVNHQRGADTLNWGRGRRTPHESPISQGFQIHMFFLHPKSSSPLRPSLPSVLRSAPFSLGSPIRDFHLAPQPAGGRGARVGAIVRNRPSFLPPSFPPRRSPFVFPFLASTSLFLSPSYPQFPTHARSASPSVMMP